MKRITSIISLFLLGSLPALGFSLNTTTKVATTDGSQADVAAAIASASVVDDWTVLIPAGLFTWNSGVTISGKGVKLQGAGAGRVIGRSTSSVAVGTGTKTFITQSGLPISNGQTLRIERTGTEVVGGNATGTRTYMIGTVTSYSGTSLTFDVTTTGGSGTHPLWIISTMPVTTIVKSITGIMLNITEDASHSVELSGVKLVWGTGAGSAITFSPVSGGKPIMVHDCYFESGAGTASATIWSYGLRGLVYECSFAAFPFSYNDQPVVIYASTQDTWTSASVMGANDTTGTGNFYIENCDFHAFLNSTDLDDNARAVLRHNLFNNSGIGTHGADTSNYGARHYEIYENTFLFNGYNDGNTLNLNYYFFLRGGTGVIYNNAIADIVSTDYGNKPEITMTVMNLQRNGGPNACWGANIGGVQYPAPRQVGMGRVTGTAGNDSVTYVGDSEPLYVWGNSGTYVVSVQDYGGSECTNPDSSTDYIIAGRDYFNNETAKPSWTAYTYPHPLRSSARPAEEPPVVTASPQNVVSPQGQNVSFTVLVSGTAPFTYQWQKNQANIAGATSSAYSISTVKTNDAGNYRCVISNLFGTANSAAASLTVNVLVPASITAQPQSLTRSVGQSATFTVNAAGDAPILYQWQRDGVNIVGASSASYTISSVQTNDAGSFRCLASNASGSATSAVATLTVSLPAAVAPSITVQPQSLTRTVGQSATFTVTAAGDAPLAYQWQKNLANIAGATSASYTIASAQTNDAGSYRCLVSNAYGSATSVVATLMVNAMAAGNVRYVDFTAGNDSNAGTIASPWKRCPGMVGWAGSATLQPGDTVYFDRADTWDIGAINWGAGLDLKAGVHYLGNEWDPQGVGSRRAMLRATGRHESGNVRFWEDHASLATQIEGFEINGNGYRANGIDFNHAFWTTGLTDAVKRVRNCVVHGQTGNGSEGDYKYGIIVSDNSPDASGWVANVEILDTTVYDVPRNAIGLYPGDNGMVSNIVVRGCDVSQANSDLSYQASTHGIGIKGNVKASLVENCYVHAVGGASIFISGPENGTGVGPTGMIVRYNILQSTAGDGVIRFYKGGGKSADIYGNIVLPNEATGGLSFAGNSGTLAARIYNNTFYNAFVDLGSPSSTGTLEFMNNIIFELDDTPLTDTAQKITAHANNVFYRSGGGTLVQSGANSYTASNLKSSYEASASGSDPLFKNVANLPTGFTGVYGAGLSPNSDGLSLQPGSPAVGTGAALSVLYNGSINSVARPSAGWDIGAYQLPAGTQPVSPPSGLKVIGL